MGPCAILAGSASLLEAQNFVRAWLTGPYVVVKDAQFVKTGPNTVGVDLGAFVSDIRACLVNRSA